MSRFSRRALGARFSEGARLLWAAKETRGLSIRALATLLRAEPASVLRWLYGDQLPRAEALFAIEKRLGVRAGLWLKRPRARFVFPADREAA